MSSNDLIKTHRQYFEDAGKSMVRGGCELLQLCSLFFSCNRCQALSKVRLPALAMYCMACMYLNFITALIACALVLR